MTPRTTSTLTTTESPIRPHPERLDVTREQDSRREVHVGFGHGLHYCLGAALARNEVEIAIYAGSGSAGRWLAALT